MHGIISDDYSIRSVKIQIQGLKEYLALFIFLFSLNLLSLNFIAYSQEYLRVAGLLFSIVAFLLLFDREKVVKKDALIGVVLIALSLLTLFAFQAKELWVLSLLLFILGTERITRKGTTISAGVLLYSLILILYKYTAVNFSAFSIALTSSLGTLIGRPTALGTAPSGFWIFLSFILVGFTIIIINRNILRFFIFLLSSFGVWILSLLFYNLFFSFTTIFFYQLLLFVLLAILTIFFVKKTGETKIKTKAETTKFRAGAIVMVVLVSVSLILLTLSPLLVTGTGKTGKVVFYEKNCVMGFDLPTYPEGALEPYNGLSIGAMALFLEKLGYGIEHFTQETEETLQDLLADASVLVLINPENPYPADEIGWIEEFVRNGGGLLVFGEHTNMFVDDAAFQSGHHPLNDVLSFTGIRVNPDTADWPHGYWGRPLEILPSPVTVGLDEDYLWISSVGASLDLNGSAKPLIVAKYGFSDDPDPFSPGHLGNREYELHERLGDVVLAASDEYGDGKVLVFGDTSYVFNDAVPSKWRLISNSFNYLTGTEIKSIGTIGATLLVLSVLIFIFLIFISGSGDRTDFHILISLFLIVSMIAPPMFASTDTDIKGQEIAWIDYTHMNKFNLAPSEDDGLEGFCINLMRNEYLPLIMDEQSLLEKGKILVIIAPAMRYSGKEAEMVERWVKNGGVLVLSAGAGERDNVKTILDVFGADIGDLPLGPVPWIMETHGRMEVSQENLTKYWNKPKFMEAYPVYCSGEYKSYASLNYEGERYDLIVGKKYGDGAFILIGDPRFLHSQNLEKELNPQSPEPQYLLQWAGNIGLIKEIFTDLGGVL
ncbi:MAG: Gldg family protein [Candidatus Thermoplasmatota archaeon]|nr:Gldg family protein [Candidatus Thermoplasmatota archaeon]